MTLVSATPEILIIGAGPVGLTAALELKRRGFHPRIIDRNSGPNPNSRALAINPRTLDLLEASRASAKLIAKGIKTRRIVFRRNTKVLAQLDLATIPHKYNFLLILAQHQTEVILEQCLAQLGVKVERNLALINLKNPEEPYATLSNGEKLSPKFVIGCDGAHSVVREALGLKFGGESDPDQFGLADLSLKDWPFDDETMVLTIMDNHLAPYLPLAKGFGRFVTTVPDCLNHLPPDAKVTNVEWQTDFKVSYRQTETYQQGQCFIAGDAAHIHSPVGGRGMNLGIEDACWLAWLIAEGGQDAYTSLRHPVGAAVLKFTHRFTAFAKARGPLQNFAIRIALPILQRLPFLQKRVFQNITALNTPAPPWL